MLKINKTRQLNAVMYVLEEGNEIPVKNVSISYDKNGLSDQNDYITDKELYAKYRTEMRKDETELIAIRYKIEDEIIAELEQETEPKPETEPVPVPEA